MADHRAASETDAPAEGTSVSGVFSAPDGREGSWLPAWRVAGAAFIAYPIVRIIGQPPEPVVAALVLAATASFTLLLWAVARRDPMDPRRASPWLVALDVAILGLVAAAEIRAPGQGWFVLFYYASTAASTLLPERRAVGLIVTAGVVAALTLTQSVDLASALIQGLSVSIIGVTVFAMTALRRTNVKLHAARQELATLAVAEERNRIARDLHDVLGHSLSLIAIKSELAGRLLPGEPERARAEIADVEQVAREALASVRETVRRLPAAEPRSRARECQGRPRCVRDRCHDRTRCRPAPVITGRRPCLGGSRGRDQRRAAQRGEPRDDPHIAARDPGRARGRRRWRARAGECGRRPLGSTASDGTGLQGLRERLEGQGDVSTPAPVPAAGIG